MSDLLAAFRARLLADKRAPRTLDTYDKIATAFLGSLSGEPPTDRHVETFLGRLRRDGRPRATTSRNQELAALRSLAKVAVRAKHWTENPTVDVRFTRKVRHDPVVLSMDELRHLFRAAAEKPPAGERLQLLAILGLLSQTALRVHELVALNLPQVDLVTGTLLAVRGKGDTIHDLPLNAPAVALLTAWLQERTVRAPPGEQALFLSSRRTRLSIRTVENWFVKLRPVVGTAKQITPHTLRHTAATVALTMGIDLATVGELLRHRDLNTTRLYTHLVDTRRREAVRTLAVTVPQEVLEATVSPLPPSPPVQLPAKVLPLAVREPKAFPREETLDGQYGFVANA